MRRKIQIPWFHHFGNFLMRVLFRLVLKLDIQGLDHTPRQGPFIVATNHTVFLDPVLATAHLRPDVLPMAKAEVFESPFALVFKGYGAFPVRRGEADLAALKRALQILHENHGLLMAPEGHRSETGILQDAHEGIALIAVKSGAPILPVAMWGGKFFWQNLKHLKRTPVAMRVGEPLVVVPLKGKPTREMLRAITDELMYYIASMLPREYRGRYADLEKVNPQYLYPQREMKVQAEPKEVMSLLK